MSDKMTSQEALALLNDLFSGPDKAKAKPKASTKAKVKEPAKDLPITPIQRNRAYTPTLSIVEVVHQRCVTCGGEHQHIRARLVRFETTAKGTLHTAIEATTLSPDAIPRRVDHTYEDTNVCPSCLTLSTLIDDFTAFSQPFTQMELFHG